MEDSNAAIIRAARRLLPYYGHLPDVMRTDAGRSEAFKAGDLLTASLARAAEGQQLLPAAVGR